MRCVLVSFFDSANLGDCIIADSLYNLISTEFFTEKYSYIGNPETITDINNISATNLPKKKNTKEIIYDSLKKINFTFPIVLFRKLKPQQQSLNNFEAKMQNSEVLIIGGGNMIFDIDQFSNSASRFNKYVNLAKKHSVKIFAISLGIGPFQTAEQEKNAFLALSKCDYITFRDKKSYDIYAKYTKDLDNVFLSVDPVFSLPYSLKKEKSKGRIIGLNIFNNKLIGDSNQNYESLINGYVELIKKLNERLGVKVLLFSTDLKDYEAIRDISSHFSGNKNVEVSEINGFDALISLYEKIDVLIGARMHSMIIAYTQYIPIIGLSWQPKIDAFFDIINLNNDVYKYDELESSIDSIVTSCIVKIDNYEYERKSIKERLNKLLLRRDIDKKILETLAKEKNLT